MFSQTHRFINQGSALAALVVVAVAAPAHQGPVAVKPAAHATVSAIIHAAPVAVSRNAAPDIVHGFP